MTIEAIIFDLDNTLVNRKLAFKAFTDRFIEQFLVYTDEQHKQVIADYIQVADRDGYRKKRELYEEIMNTFEMKQDETTTDHLLEYWFSQFYTFTVLMDGATDILDYLKNKKIKLGLITNGSSHAQNQKLDQVQLRDYFDTIIISDEVNVKKPDKKIFELILDKMNAEPSSSWYVGDQPVNDIKGAREAGLNAIWLDGFTNTKGNWDEKEQSQKPNYTIQHLSQIKAIIDMELTNNYNRSNLI